MFGIAYANQCDRNLINVDRSTNLPRMTEQGIQRKRYSSRIGFCPAVAARCIVDLLRERALRYYGIMFGQLDIPADGLRA